jgi:hypothetical protein
MFLVPSTTDSSHLSLFSYTSSAFWLQNSKRSARIQFFNSTEVSQPPPSSYFDHFYYAPPISDVISIVWIVPRKVKYKGVTEQSTKITDGVG